MSTDDTLTHFERMATGPGARFTGWSSFEKVRGLYERIAARAPEEELRRDIIAAERADPTIHLSLAREAVRVAMEKNGLNYVAIGNEPLVHHFLGWFEKTIGLHAASFFYQMLYQTNAHDREGRKVYSLTTDLAERLKHTELRGIQAEDLRLPFPAIYVVIPESLGFTLIDGSDVVFPVIGAYIVEEDNVGETAVRPKGDHGWRVMLCGKPRPMPRVSDSGAMDDETLFYSIRLPAGANMDECLALSDRDHVAAEMQGNVLPPLRKSNMAVWKDAFLWLMNVVLYITNAEPMAKEQITDTAARHLSERIHRCDKAKKRDELKERLRGMQLKKRIVLGGAIQKAEGGIPIGSSPGVLTRVSGHWRKQAHGKGWSERKLIWIEPFWRGREDAPVREPERYEVT